MEKSSYKVGIRIESTELTKDISIKNKSIDMHNTSYVFDKIFNPGCSQEYFEFIEPTLNESFKGININITGCNNTLPDRVFKIINDNDFLVMSLESLFSSDSRQFFTFSCSFMQVTDDSIQDLLQTPGKSQRLSIKKDINNLVLIENLAEFVVEKSSDCMFLVSQGLSSKSYSSSLYATTIFQVLLESRKANHKGLFLKSKVNFIDLAASGDCFKAFNACLHKLSVNEKVSYKDSKLTQVLSDSLNHKSLNLFITTISILPDQATQTLETLNTMNLLTKVLVNPEKNLLSFNKTVKANFDENLKIKTSIKYKKNYDEVWGLKEETEKLKKILNKKTSIEEVEDLIKENKNLRVELQQLIGRPLAENDLERPESFQDALVLTEDLIKRRKLDLASAEMKEKLAKDNRCQVCTLKLPCKHTTSSSLVLYNPSTAEPKPLAYQAEPRSNTPTFVTNSEVEVPHKFRIRSLRGRVEVLDKRYEDKDEKSIKEAQKRLNILSKIEAYREEKLRNEILKMEKEAQIEKELIEKKKSDEEKKKKYFDMQKERILQYGRKKEVEKKKDTRPHSQKIRRRPQSNNVKIRDYDNKKSLVMEILRQQSKIIKGFKNQEESQTKIPDSVDLLSRY
jgi:Kinesin motor domain